MKRTRLAFFGLAILVGCSHHVPRATVVLLDTSLSITPRAEKAALDAAEASIGRMERGDRLVLIPITADALNTAGGRILRLQAPQKRESYDTDLRRFREDAQKQFVLWASSLNKEQRTDILGTLDAARQELTALPKDSRRSLIVLSDFLEDDEGLRFASDAALSNPSTAQGLALRLRDQHRFSSDRASICLGRLESNEFSSLPTARREAIQAFWNSYFAEHNSSPEILIDGPSLLVTGKCSSEASQARPLKLDRSRK